MTPDPGPLGLEGRRRFDWSEARARLERAGRTPEASPEQAVALMEERARALARVLPREPGPSEVVEVASFALGGARYAIETRYITQVLRLAEFTPVPGSPGFLVGLINLRGEVLALFDLHAYLGVAGPGPTDLSRVIVLGLGRDEFGILADAVEEVATLRVSEILEAPASLPGGARLHLRGVTAEGRVLLDGAALIADEGLSVDQADEGPVGKG